MHGDSIPSIEVIRARSRALSERAAGLTALRGSLSDKLRDMEREVDSLESRQARLSKVVELFRFLMDKMVEEHVRMIDRVITDGLRTIFHDQGLAFESDIRLKYNRVFVDFVMSRGDHRGHPMKAFGGGPASVISLLLRLITLMRMKRMPILFLDELLSMVSDDYVDQTGKFLKALAKRAGTDILLITHKQAFLEHADLAYQGQEVPDGSRSKLAIKRLGRSREKP